MAKAKLTIAVAGAVLGAAALAGPGLLAGRLEARFRDWAEQVSTPSHEVTVERYERGWFSSTAEVSVALALRGLTEPITLRGTETLRHGPVAFGGPCGVHLGLATVHSRLVVPERYAEEARARLFPGGALATTCAYVGPAGDVEGEGRIAGYEGPIPGAVGAFTAVRWAPATVRYRYSADLVERRVDIDAPRLEAHGRGERMAVEGMSFMVNSEQVHGPLQNVSGRLDMARMEVAMSDAGEARATPLVYEQPSFGFDSKVESGRVNSSFSATVRSGRVADDEFGTVELHLALERLNAKAVQRVSEQFQMLAESGASVEEIQQQSIALWLEALPELVSDSPVLKIGPVTYEGEHGDLELHGEATFDGREGFGSSQGLVQRLSASAELSASASLMLALEAKVLENQLRKAGATQLQIQRALSQHRGQVLANWQAQGLIEKAGERYRSRLALESGRLTVNGRPLGLGGSVP
ncbi:MAG: YdgA family protein [Gammaproteobacteria bacterium]|nr:YdgA family protein [Gammaproteobacteria bacterium]